MISRQHAYHPQRNINKELRLQIHDVHVEDVLNYPVIYYTSMQYILYNIEKLLCKI